MRPISPTRAGLNLIGAVAVAAATAVPARAQAAAVSLDYDVHYGPIPVMSVHTTTELDADRYRATTDMRTIGPLRFLFPWSAGSTAVGWRAGDVLRPQHYRTAGEYRGEPRLADIDYPPDGSLRVHTEPPADADDRDPVASALQTDTVDPLTATLAAVSSGCRGMLRVFDGRRRYDLTLSDLGEVAALPSSRPIYAGPAQHCRGAIAPLAGFWRTSAQRGEQPSHIEYWVARPRPDLVPVPVYLELSAPAGTLAVSLTAIGDAGAPQAR